MRSGAEGTGTRDDPHDVVGARTPLKNDFLVSGDAHSAWVWVLGSEFNGFRVLRFRVIQQKCIKMAMYILGSCFQAYRV